MSRQAQRAAIGGARNRAAKAKAALKREDLRQAILEAAAAAGEEFGEGGLTAYLRAQALAAPSPFLTLLGKALAKSGESAPEPVRLIELVPAPPQRQEAAGGEKKDAGGAASGGGEAAGR